MNETESLRCVRTAVPSPKAISALLAGEHQAPQVIHARAAVHDLIRGLLIAGRTGPDLRGLARG